MPQGIFSVSFPPMLMTIFLSLSPAKEGEDLKLYPAVVVYCSKRGHD